MTLPLLVILCLSFMTPADAWISNSLAKKALERSIGLDFIPATQNEDFLKTGHRDEVEELVIIHKDTDEAEKYFEDAHIEFEDMLGDVKNSNPFFGTFSLEQKNRPRTRTPKEEHYLLTALDSWKKISQDIDNGTPNDLCCG